MLRPFQPVGASRSDAPQPGASEKDDGSAQYSVLYYKRKNKVHKSKGVSKMDGILNVISNGNFLGLTTPTGDTIVAPRREAHSSMDWEENTVITVGGYEVEIVAQLRGAPSSSKNPCKATATVKRPLLANRAPSFLTGKIARESAEKPLLHRKPLLSRKVSPVPAALTNSSLLSTPGFAQHVPPKGRLLPMKRACPLPSQPLVASGPRGVAKRPLVPLLHRASNTAAADGSFPGAVGTIDVPHSIRTALKPHQRTGLVFLWNSLHRHPEDQSYRGGAILADEMGLGKTLMTIATVCALYRKQRDKVRSRRSHITVAKI
jgi:SNF2-related domain